MIRLDGASRALVRMALPCVLALAPAAGIAQTFPSRPIHFIVPFPPGGGSGIVARMLQPKLSEMWGQPVVVENRPGGNTVIGHEAILRMPPDGHAFVISTPQILLTSMFQKISIDPFRDLAPLTTLYNSEQVLTASPSLPVTNLKELIALAKQKPGELTFATVGLGGSTHIAAEVLNLMAGIKLRMVNYKGAGPALVDQMAGHVQLSFTAPSAALNHIRSGKVRAIAITGDKRTPALSEVPTFPESGFPDFGGTIWFGVQAHGKTPKAIVNRLSADIGKIVMQPDVSEALVKQATQPYVMTPEAFAARIKADYQQYAEIIRKADIRIQ